ncbi:hypothetical protein [Kitasatospora purpeofusca]|uniref:hypothetical protein n=1 Tax=Kitasatospora purpeofusca TaxID=67352 RepID=UPI002259A607|nr:hypothetical protein [Kitasatospora purpeofusca]MCX4752929.1 hypothetical protein [Kitasatospora purpeofusca]WSR32472.1 hypothetical protein OG715_16650 [Kitasatospora purpeofusca]
MAYAEKRLSQAKGKKGKATWRARFKKPDGSWDSEPGFPTKNTALEYGQEQEAAIRAGTWIDPKLGRVRFGEWALEWLQAQSPRGRTTDNRWNLLESHILPQWRDTALIAFNWFEVEAWARRLAGTVAESTIRDAVGLLSRILTGAVDARRIPVNHLYNRRLTGVDAASGARRGLQAATAEVKPPVVPFATTETVLRLARRLGPLYGLHVLTTAFAGPRWEELVGLHRDNALLTRTEADEHGGMFTCPIIRIDAEIGALAEYAKRDPETGKRKAFRGIEPLKNPQSARDIDLPPFLAELLQQHLDARPYDYVFSTAKGKWWWRNAWYEIIRPAADGRPARPPGRGRPACEEWEPLHPGLTMRRLRHTHDTWQAEEDVHPLLQHEQAGHKYPGIKGVYQHPTPSMRRHRLAAFERRYERTMKALGWDRIWEAQ